ncbi:RNA-binding domain-containing protein [Piedraia hortae CBS 480.64]|uniref:RNA-binding domain-containing protein n=1 Tax=Piedraia hortae CBS 480.64 TaxID=1314780 RepID=A0A6A7BSG7_9PEZI|nr:RNA-binding domain-containing protein [Piedraia hortae CBS 480.64]
MAVNHTQDKDCTLYVGNLDERCTDAMVWELMLQAGPVINVHLPKDRVSQSHQGYGFVEFGSEEDADYAAKVMHQIRLWGKPIRVNKASVDRRVGAGAGGDGGPGVGAELFVGNLDGMVDEKSLYDTFSRFGPLLAPPKIARDEATNLSKGYGFISYTDFDASDAAMHNMNGQYLGNKQVSVAYAYKRDGKGERHGDAAERALAAEAKKHGVQVPVPAMPPSLVMPPNVPTGPTTPAASVPGQPGWGAPPMQPYGFSPVGMPPPGMQPMIYGQAGMPQGMPPAMPAKSGGASRPFNVTPLTVPPTGAGLPARPPPSMAGYGGPAVAPGLPPHPVPHMAAPPPGFRPGVNGYPR